MDNKLKILAYDIEILPRHFYTNFGADRSTLCSFCYKWVGDKKTHKIDLFDRKIGYPGKPFNEKELVQMAHTIMSQADLATFHFGSKFDGPYMDTKFIQYGLDPVHRNTAFTDTWRTARYKLKLSSNRLENIAKYFKLDAQKMDIPISTWFDIIAGDAKAMRLMTKYCKVDVDTLEAVYLHLQQLHVIPVHGGAARGHGRPSCPNPVCGSDKIFKDGARIAASGLKYQKFGCRNCGRRFNNHARMKDE